MKIFPNGLTVNRSPLVEPVPWCIYMHHQDAVSSFILYRCIKLQTCYHLYTKHFIAFSYISLYLKHVAAKGALSGRVLYELFVELLFSMSYKVDTRILDTALVFCVRLFLDSQLHCDMIDLLHQFYNATVPYRTVHHFVKETCVCVHILLQNDAVWDIYLIHWGFMRWETK